jgi:hypothetical protein
MSRRKRRNERTLAALLGVLLLAWVVIRVLQSVSEVVIFATIAVAAALFARKLLRPSRLRKEATAKLDAAIGRYMDQLVRQRAKLVRPGPYGKRSFDDWNQHMHYFVSEHLAPILTPEEKAAGRISLHATVSEREGDGGRASPSISGVLRKAHSDGIRSLLRGTTAPRPARRADVTRHSRDQGVDIIAEKAGVPWFSNASFIRPGGKQGGAENCGRTRS